MAKGLRSSVKKANRSRLRARVFGPVEDARTERLHSKLVEAIQQPKPEPPKKSEMDIDSAQATDKTAQEAAKEDDYPKEMEVDSAASSAPTKSQKKDDRKKRKQRGRKPKNQISFPTSRGKGALKPFSESRIRKRR